MFQPMVTEEIFQHTLSILYNIHLLQTHFRHSYSQDWHITQQCHELRQHLQAITIINIIHDIFSTAQINTIFDHVTKL